MIPPRAKITKYGIGKQVPDDALKPPELTLETPITKTTKSKEPRCETVRKRGQAQSDCPWIRALDAAELSSRS
jgi:hypothetical protein